MRESIRRLAPLLSGALAACAGNGKGLGADGLPVTGQGGGSTTVTADFASIQQHVFTPICSVCHAGASAPQGLRLDSANSYALLVGVPSTEDPSVLRVKPGDPANSYIIQKVKGIAAVGSQMPLGEAALPESTIQAISQWISEGAQRPAGAVEPVRFALESVVPAPAEQLNGGDARIFIGFSHGLNPAQLGSMPLRLRRMPDAAEIPLTARMPGGNDRELMLEPATPLEGGHYVLELGGMPGAGVWDRYGNPLPGIGDAEVLPLASFDVEARP